MTDIFTMTPDLVAAINGFVDRFNDGSLSGDVAEKLSCEEVERLADLFRALGLPDAADMWLRDHAADDDEGDRHVLTDGTVLPPCGDDAHAEDDCGRCGWSVIAERDADHQAGPEDEPEPGGC